MFKGIYRSALGLFLAINLLTFNLAQVDVFTLAKEGTLYDVVIGVGDGADFNEKDAYGQTPLMYAASENEDEGVIRLLVNSGADINAESLAGWTPLMYAARDTSNPEVLRTLLELGANSAVENDEGLTAADYAASNPAIVDITVVAQLENPSSQAATRSPEQADAPTSPEPLSASVQSDSLEVTTTDTSTLEAASGTGLPSSYFFDLVKVGTVDEIEAALRLGADVNAADEYGQTALMYAASHNESPEIFTLLVEEGADVNATSLAAWSPLMYAVRDNPKPDVVLALLELGADPNLVNEDSQKALAYITQNVALLGTPAYNGLQTLTTEATPEPTQEPEPQPVASCCKICSKGKACGNSCISRSYTCRKGAGCACNASDLDPELLKFVSQDLFDTAENQLDGLNLLVASTLPCEMATLFALTF